MDTIETSKTYTERILRLAEVKLRTGLGRSTIYFFIKKGQFPKPINLGMRSVGWPESEISSWIQTRISERR